MVPVMITAVRTSKSQIDRSVPYLFTCRKPAKPPQVLGLSKHTVQLAHAIAVWLFHFIMQNQARFQFRRNSMEVYTGANSTNTSVIIKEVCRMQR